MSANPVYDRLTAHSRPPSLRATVISGGVLLIASMVGTALWMAATPHLLDAYDASQVNSVGLYARGAWAFQLADQVATAVWYLYAILIMAALGLAIFLSRARCGRRLLWSFRPRASSPKQSPAG